MVLLYDSIYDRKKYICTHTHTHTHLLEREITTLSSIVAWESHGQRSLVGYSPWGHKESNTTEQLSTHTYASTETQRKEKSYA